MPAAPSSSSSSSLPQQAQVGGQAHVGGPAKALVVPCNLRLRRRHRLSYASSSVLHEAQIQNLSTRYNISETILKRYLLDPPSAHPPPNDSSDIERSASSQASSDLEEGLASAATADASAANKEKMVSEPLSTSSSSSSPTSLKEPPVQINSINFDGKEDPDPLTALLHDHQDDGKAETTADTDATGSGSASDTKFGIANLDSIQQLDEFEKLRLERVYRPWEEQRRRIRAEFGTPAMPFATSTNASVPLKTTTLLQTRLANQRDLYRRHYHQEGDMSNAIKAAVKHVRYLSSTGNGVAAASIHAEREWYRTYPLLWQENVDFLDGIAVDLRQRFEGIRNRMETRDNTTNNDTSRGFCMLGGETVHSQGVEFDNYIDENAQDDRAAALSSYSTHPPPADISVSDFNEGKQDVGDSCVEWRCQILQTQDLICRLYLEMALIGVFVDYIGDGIDGYKYEYLVAALARIRSSLFGIAHPVASLYARAYVARWCKLFLDKNSASSTRLQRISIPEVATTQIRQLALGLLNDHILRGSTIPNSKIFQSKLDRIDLKSGDIARIQSSGLHCLVRAFVACSAYDQNQIQHVVKGNGRNDLLFVPLQQARSDFWSLTKSLLSDKMAAGVMSTTRIVQTILHEFVKCFHPSVYCHRALELVTAIRCGRESPDADLNVSSSMESSQHQDIYESTDGLGDDEDFFVGAREKTYLEEPNMNSYLEEEKKASYNASANKVDATKSSASDLEVSVYRTLGDALLSHFPVPLEDVFDLSAVVFCRIQSCRRLSTFTSCTNVWAALVVKAAGIGSFRCRPHLSENAGYYESNVSCYELISLLCEVIGCIAGDEENSDQNVTTGSRSSTGGRRGRWIASAIQSCNRAIKGTKNSLLVVKSIGKCISISSLVNDDNWTMELMSHLIETLDKICIEIGSAASDISSDESVTSSVQSTLMALDWNDEPTASFGVALIQRFSANI